MRRREEAPGPATIKCPGLCDASAATVRCRACNRRGGIIARTGRSWHSSFEVAGALRIQVVEVRTDISAAIRALGARSKLEAVVIALRDGLIELRDT